VDVRKIKIILKKAFLQVKLLELSKFKIDSQEKGELGEFLSLMLSFYEAFEKIKKNNEWMDRIKQNKKEEYFNQLFDFISKLRAIAGYLNKFYPDVLKMKTYAINKFEAYYTELDKIWRENKKILEEVDKLDWLWNEVERRLGKRMDWNGLIRFIDDFLKVPWESRKEVSFLDLFYNLSNEQRNKLIAIFNTFIRDNKELWEKLKTEWRIPTEAKELLQNLRDLFSSFWPKLKKDEIENFLLQLRGDVLEEVMEDLGLLKE